MLSDTHTHTHRGSNMGIINWQNESDTALIDVQNRAEGRLNHSSSKWIHYDDQPDMLLLQCREKRRGWGGWLEAKYSTMTAIKSAFVLRQGITVSWEWCTVRERHQVQILYTFIQFISLFICVLIYLVRSWSRPVHVAWTNAMHWTHMHISGYTCFLYKMGHHLYTLHMRDLNHQHRIKSADYWCNLTVHFSSLFPH